MTSGVQPRSRFRPRAGRAGARPGEGAGPRGGARGVEGRGLPRRRSPGRTHAAPFAGSSGRCFSPTSKAPSASPGPPGSGRMRLSTSLTSAGYSDANGLKALRNLKGASNETNISITNATQQLVLAYSFVLGKVAGEVTERTVSTQPRSHTKETRPGTFYS